MFYYSAENFCVVIPNAECDIKQGDSQPSLCEAQLFLERSLYSVKTPKELILELCKNNNGRFFISYYDESNYKTLPNNISNLIERLYSTFRPVVLVSSKPNCSDNPINTKTFTSGS